MGVIHLGEVMRVTFSNVSVLVVRQWGKLSMPAQRLTVDKAWFCGSLPRRIVRLRHRDKRKSYTLVVGGQR